MASAAISLLLNEIGAFKVQQALAKAKSRAHKAKKSKVALTRLIRV